MKRLLVVGHRGMLGTDLVKRLEAGDVETHGADLPELDITDPAAVARAVDEVRPDVVVNCAAYTDVDGAESHRDEAMRVNGPGAGNVAEAAARCDARVLHISTDFVFDGTADVPYLEDDAPHPLSVYGASKLAGERDVAARADDHLIIRTSWLYGAAGRNFVTTIRKLAAEREELSVVDDQRGSPTWTCDLADAIVALLDTDARGIVHASGSGACTWYEFAVEIVRLSGFATAVKPIASTQMLRPARRPANSVLDTSRLAEVTAFRFPHWHDSLAAFLADIA